MSKKRCLSISKIPLQINNCIAPNIVVQPQSLQVTAGDSPTFSISVSGTNIQYQWRKNGVPIFNATHPTFTIVYADTNDAGEYTVEVFNDCGALLSNVALLVVSGSGACVAPFITSNPSGESVLTGDSVTFNVVATGTGPLSYQWQKNGANISGAHSSSYSIIYALSTDIAIYRCIVTNGCGIAESEAAGLSVHDAGGGGTGGGAGTGSL